MRHSYLLRNGTRRALTSDRWHSEIMASGYRAVIFDCDGTLVDSADLHFRSFQAALNAQGHDMKRNWYDSRTGLDRVSTLEAVAASAVAPLDIQKAVQDSIAFFIANSASVKPIPQVSALVKRLVHRCQLGVGTNAEEDIARASLKATGLLHCFKHISSVSLGLPPKPAPDIFQDAAEKLGEASSETLVIEDSDQGVQAALAAGLGVIRLM